MNKSKVIINFLWRFFERISAQLVTFVVSIILARLLLPEDYGAISIIMVFITLANVLVNNGFATALIQKKNADDLDFSSVFYFSLAFSIILYAILFTVAPFIASIYEMPILCPALRVLGIRVIVGAINSVQQSYVSRNMIFKKFFFATLGGTIFSAIVGIIMAYCGYGLWALVMQYLLNTTVDTFVLWITVKWRPKKCFSFERLKSLLKYGWKLLASALVGTLYDDLRTLIIGKVYSKNDLAYYTRGQQFPKLIITNLNTSVSSVIFPVLSSMQDDVKRVANANRKSMQVSSAVIAPLMLGMAAIAPPLIKLLLTDKWLPSVPFLQLCCIFYLITSFYTTYLQVFKALGKSGLALIIELVDDIIGIILIIIFFKYGVIMIALITIISRLIACIVCMFLNKKIINLDYRKQLYDIGMPILISMIMFVVVYLIGKIKINYIALMIIQIIIGMLLYIVMSLILKMPIIKVVKEFINNYKLKNKRK